MKIVSLFSGAGGLDLGFEQAGFDVIWANEYDASIFETYKKNHSATLCTTDIRKLNPIDIPDSDGIIGGPPCQSWSVGGAQQGFDDPRGRLFHDYTRVIYQKKPLFFVIENVPGLLLSKNLPAYNTIISELRACGYRIFSNILNSADFDVPQNRERLILVGIRNDLEINFVFPKPSTERKTLYEAIYDLRGRAIPVNRAEMSRIQPGSSHNHQYLDMSFPKDYMKYNKVRPWSAQSYTIRTNGKYMLLHPDSPLMIKNREGSYQFCEGKEAQYRRLSVRECARIQTYPDDFIFYYNNILDGYTMVGNSVPINLAYQIARKIKDAFSRLFIS